MSRPHVPSAPPAVSVVVPYFAQPRYLVECVSSVLHQSFEQLEVIVVDDASPGQTAAQLLTALVKSDERVRIVRHPANQGLGAARNTGFRAALAEYVVPVDADDVLDPEFVKRTVAVLRKDSDVDCVFTDLRVFGTQEYVRRLALHAMEDLLVRQWIPGPGVLMRRQLWADIGGYPELAAFRAGDEDWDFWLGAMERGFTPRHLAVPLYHYRTHGDSMTSTTLSYRSAELHELMYRRHRRLFARHGRGRAFRADGLRRSAVASAERCER